MKVGRGEAEKANSGPQVAKAGLSATSLRHGMAR